MVRGEYQVKPPRPFTPGNEVAGDRARPWARMWRACASASAWWRCRALADLPRRVVAAQSRTLPLPDAMDFARAGGFMLVYGTSLHALADCGAPGAGETLLVLGAAGGVGLAAVEIGARWARA